MAVKAEADSRRLGYRRIADVAVWLRLGSYDCQEAAPRSSDRQWQSRRHQEQVVELSGPAGLELLHRR